MNITKRSAIIYVKKDWYKHTRDYMNGQRIKIPEHSMAQSGKYPLALRITMELTKN